MYQKQNQDNYAKGCQNYNMVTFTHFLSMPFMLIYPLHYIFYFSKHVGKSYTEFQKCLRSSNVQLSKLVHRKAPTHLSLGLSKLYITYRYCAADNIKTYRLDNKCTEMTSKAFSIR